jgi:hypothetical protein
MSIRDKYLLILYDRKIPLKNDQIKRIAGQNGWREGERRSPSAFLGSGAARHLVVQIPDGWVLTSAGMEKFGEKPSSLSQTLHAQVISPLAAALEGHAKKLKDKDRAAFVFEAVNCLKGRHYRAAVVLSWVGALAVLYEFILSEKLAAFNSNEVSQKHLDKPAKNFDDLSKIRESTFLIILEKIGVLTPSQKKELNACLDRRNTAGHPNSQVFREPIVAAHIDTLIVEVFQRF